MLPRVIIFLPRVGLFIKSIKPKQMVSAVLSVSGGLHGIEIEPKQCRVVSR